MPFTVEQLAYGGRIVLDWYIKNDPIDQINQERPLLKKLIEGKSEYGGALQYVVEQLRFSNDSNFQSYFGAQQVTYNRKRTVQQAKYTWGAFHDGFGLDEDELVQAGIVITEDTDATPTANEKIALTDLLKENMETLKLGFQENFDIMLHRDGTQSTTDIPGLDLLIKLDPTTSTVVGGLNQSTNTWWRNNVTTTLAVASGSLIDEYEKLWRACMRYGGFKPDFILVGATALDAYRNASGQTINRQITDGGNQKGGVSIDKGTTAIYFKGVELIWDPVFETMDTLDAPATAWSKRFYFINTRFLKLRPIKGHWMVSRRPPRVYDRYVHYWALTSKAALTTGKRNAHGVGAVA